MESTKVEINATCQALAGQTRRVNLRKQKLMPPVRHTETAWAGYYLRKQKLMPPVRRFAAHGSEISTKVEINATCQAAAPTCATEIYESRN